MGQNKKYYWLKLKENFFEEKQIKYLRSLPDGDKIVIAYLKMQLKSLKTEGFIKYDSILPSNIDELAMVLDENTNIIKLMIGALQKVNAVEILDDGSFYMIAMQDLIGKEGESAERVRRFREKERQLMPVKSEAKTNAERQKAFRAKKACEEKQYIPFIEDYINNKRYNGNYYIVMKRDAFKCRICGSIENLCVHHIDGFNELKLENSNANKLLTLCRCCHRQIHEGLEISKDILESIDYFNESNESNDFCNNDVTNCNTEIEKEKKIEIEKEKNAEIIKCYEENIGLITPATAEILFSYNDIDYKMIIEAIKIASINNKRNCRYIQGILNSWINKGYKVVADIQKEQEEKENVKGNEEHQETKEERIARLKKEWGIEDED